MPASVSTPQPMGGSILPTRIERVQGRPIRGVGTDTRTRAAIRSTEWTAAGYYGRTCKTAGTERMTIRTAAAEASPATLLATKKSVPLPLVMEIRFRIAAAWDRQDGAAQRGAQFPRRLPERFPLPPTHGLLLLRHLQTTRIATICSTLRLAV